MVGGRGGAGGKKGWRTAGVGYEEEEERDERDVEAGSLGREVHLPKERGATTVAT